MIVKNEDSDSPALKRSLTLPLLTLYGLGVTVGAGIYVLIGATVAPVSYTHLTLPTIYSV